MMTVNIFNKITDVLSTTSVETQWTKNIDIMCTTTAVWLWT